MWTMSLGAELSRGKLVVVMSVMKASIDFAIKPQLDVDFAFIFFLVHFICEKLK